MDFDFNKFKFYSARVRSVSQTERPTADRQTDKQTGKTVRYLLLIGRLYIVVL